MVLKHLSFIQLVMRTYYEPGTVLFIVNTEERDTQLCTEEMYNLVRDIKKFFVFLFLNYNYPNVWKKQYENQSRLPRKSEIS